MDARKPRRPKRLGEYLISSDQGRQARVENPVNARAASTVDARQSRLVISLVNDVLSGKRIAATFTLDSRGQFVEAGSRKVIERGDG